VQSVLPAYLDMSMNTFASQQEKWRESMKAFGGLAPLNAFEDMARRNMAMFEQAFGMFMPRTRTPERQDPEPPPAVPTAHDTGADAGANALDALQAQIKAMQAQIDRLARSNGKS
jgi:polyhydroxyalkanoate synthesis regulator protein